MEKNSIPMEGGENDLKQMIKKINWLGVLPTLLVAAFMLVSVVLPHTSFASTTIPDPGLCSRVNGLNCNQYTLNGLIIRVINWILAITLAVDVLFMVIGGFLYITSAGNEERAKKGRTTSSGIPPENIPSPRRGDGAHREKFPPVRRKRSRSRQAPRR